MTNADIVDAVRSGLRRLADPERAAAMQAYMKSTMPCYGVPMPAVRQLCRTTYNEHRIESRAEWEDTVRRLFDEAGHREERYAALALTSHRYFHRFQTAESLPLYQHLIVTGAWWDLVDDVSHRVGDVLLADRDQAREAILSWSRADDRWLRRASIICQLGHRDRTDVSLLTQAVDANLDDYDFFLRKAIGWALREYAKTDPEWVRDFVATRGDSLSPLSRREALKHLRH